jgi:CDP-diglyceride synthetase
METNSPRRDAKVRIAVFFVLTAASFILFAWADQRHWAAGLYGAAFLALFNGHVANGPKTRNEPKRTASERVFWIIIFASYFAIGGFYFLSDRAPTTPLIAAVLCLMTLVFCVNMWRGVNNADEEQIRRAFKEEKWP